MSIRAEPKYKIDRRLKVNLWGREKSPINNRNYKPGQHGQRGGKLSDFGVQLMEKQKLKKHYGDIRESQFRRYYIESDRVHGDTSENLIGFLESRLDALVYRSCFAPTIFSARQLVNHNHVLVNGKRVNIPSYLASAGDVISIREKSRNIPIIIESLSSHERDIPDYLSVNQSNMSSTFIRIPKLEEIPYPTQMAPHLVVEFYSR